MFYASCTMRHAPDPMPHVPCPASYASVRMFFGFRLVLAVAFLAGSAISPSSASAQTKKFQWSPRLAVSEQYVSNVDLSPDNEEDDWITRIGPGLTLSMLFEMFFD